MRVALLLVAILVTACSSTLQSPPGDLSTSSTGTALVTPAPTFAPLSVIPTPTPSASTKPDWTAVFASIPSSEATRACTIWINIWRYYIRDLKNRVAFISLHSEGINRFRSALGALASDIGTIDNVSLNSNKPRPPSFERVIAIYYNNAGDIYERLKAELNFLSPVFRELSQKCGHVGFSSSELVQMNEAIQYLEYKCFSEQESEPQNLCLHINQRYNTRYAAAMSNYYVSSNDVDACRHWLDFWQDYTVNMIYRLQYASLHYEQFMEFEEALKVLSSRVGYIEGSRQSKPRQLALYDPISVYGISVYGTYLVGIVDDAYRDVERVSMVVRQMAIDCSGNDEEIQVLEEVLDNVRDATNRLGEGCLLEDWEEPRELCSQMNPYYYERYPEYHPFRLNQY